MVSSKYKIYQLAVVIFFTLLCVFIATIILTSGKPVSSKDAFGIVFLFFFAGYLPLSFFSHAPKIIFNPDSMVIRSFFKFTTYSWDDVAKVYLNTKENYSVFVILGQTLPAMKLEFNNGKSLIIWEDMYRNMDEMRRVITEKLNDKIRFVKKAEERTIYNAIGDKKYAGNPLTSFNTLMIAGMIIFFAFKLDINAGRNLIILIPIGFVLLFYIVLGIQMNYFEIQSDKLIIKNHYFPWKNKSYQLAEIEEVSKESPYRRSDGLRIITYQFKSKLYGAGSLRNHNWNELFKDLESIGIKVSKG